MDEEKMAEVSSQPWVDERLAEINRITDSLEKIEALVELASELLPSPLDVLQQALLVAQSLEDSSDKAQAISAIAPQLPEFQQKEVLQQALTMAQSLEDSSDKAQAISAIAPQLPESQQKEVLQQALTMAQSLENSFDKAQAISAIAPQLPESATDLLQQALLAAQSLEESYFKALVLIAVAPQLPESATDLLQQALTVAQSIEDPELKARAISAIAPRLPESQQKEVLQQALTMAQSLEESCFKTRAINEIAPRLPESATDLLQQALAIAQSLEDSGIKAQAISAIAPRLPESQQKEVLQQALAITQSLKNLSDKAQAISAIAPQLPESATDLLQQALTVAQSIKNLSNKAQAISAIALQLPESQQKEVLQQALTVAQSIEDPDHKAQAISAIALQLPESQQKEVLQQALTVAQSIEDPDHKAQAISAIALQLPESATDLLQQALTVAQSIEDPNHKARAIISIAPQLPEFQKKEVLQQALTVTQSIEDSVCKAFVLIEIASRLPESQQKEVLQQALAITQSLEESYFKAPTLSAIAPQLPESATDLLQQALTITQSLENSFDKAQAISAIAPQLPESATDLLQQALTVAQSLEDPNHKARVIISIAPQLPESQQKEVLQQALTMAQSIEHPDHKAQAISAIAPQLPESATDLLQQALTVAQSLEDPDLKARAISAIAPQLPESATDLLQQALTVAQSLEDPDLKARAISAIAPRLPESQQKEVLQQALTMAQSIEHPDHKAQAISAILQLIPSTSLKSFLETTLNLSEAAKSLAPLASRFIEDFVLLIPANKHSVALDVVQYLSSDEDKTQFLSALIPRLSPGRFPTVLELIKSQVSDDRFRAEILSNLAPYLPSVQFLEVIRLIENAIQNPDYRTSVLEALIPSSEIEFDAVLALIETLPLPQLQARVLHSLAIALVAQAEQTSSQSNKTDFYTTYCNRLIQATTNLGSTKRDDFSYESAVSNIFGQLALILKNTSETTEVSFFVVVSQLKDPGYQAEVLIALAPHFPERTKEFLESYQGDDYRNLLKIKIRLALINSSDTTDIQSIVDALETIQGRYYQAEALIEIARHPAGSRVRGLQTKALREIGELTQNPYLQAQYLQRLIPSLKYWKRIETINVIGDISDHYYQVSARVALARKFPESDIFNAALNDAEKLNSRVHRIEQLSTLAIDMPELLPRIIKCAEELHINQQPETATDEEAFSIKIERRDILVALTPHLPMRINREVNRELSLGRFVSRELYDRALYLLARGYRDALQGGTLRNDAAQDRDLLDLKDEINALSNLLLMRDLEPPMSVGILGGWGGGKSYIMHLMQARMTEIRSHQVDLEVEAWNENPNHQKLSPYVGHVYQIKFDAWTFAKSDLWASLMQTIFFELDRQLTLETQITEVLQQIEDATQRQRIESTIWSVLYKSNDDERTWFLRQVLKDKETLNLLLDKQRESRTGILWEKFKESQTTAIHNLEATEAALKTKKRELEELKSQLRLQIRQEFEPIFNLSKNQSFQRVDALLGTSFILLRRRVGQTAFKNLNTAISDQLFKSSSVGSQQAGGLWHQLEEKLAALEKAKEELEALTKPAEKSTSSDKKIDNQTSEKTATNQVDAVKTKDQLIPSKQVTDAKEEISTKQEEVNRLLREVSETRFDIFNVATNVIEKKQKWLDWQRNWKWLKSNWLLVLLFVLLFVVPLVLLTTLGLNLYTSADQQIPNLTAKLATLIAPLLPGAVILQNLLRSGQKWFEETRLALQEYQKSVENRNKDIEATYERSVKDSLESNPRLQQLEREVQALEKEYQEQKQSVPVNQYASLSEFVSDRLEQGTYKNRLGLMQQVKQDLADLSNKLLPPSQYDESFQSKIDFLKQVFPRGPARVVVYIDDLDRCPPDRVVQVLEAVQLLVKTPLFIAVLAIDERYITRALEKFYEGVLSRRGRPSGTDYLEKIIQLPYRVRPIMANTLENYLRSQVVIQDSATGAAKFSEFSRREFDMLLACCRQVDLSPRTIKRLTNVYKLFKIVCRTRGTKLTPQVQQAILALLALSGRYPNLMRGIFDDIQSCFEEQRTLKPAKQPTREQVKQASPTLHLTSPLYDFFKTYRLPEGDRYLQREFDKLQHDALHTEILPHTLTLDAMTYEIFNLIRSFSFVGEIGENPEDYRFSGAKVDDTLLESTIPDPDPEDPTIE
ncbi:P-loop NTPase fold protein [Leptolyngbya sp. GGD]|uniref:P-loop NTPase fold protein n=1 Tax=Leptolyngbya sp. GGD TaxID=2997907 RepID=UPI00227B7214|nr:P-loop NTPase fold protein [Leptolyngbya sp. GGD]MCY6492803.1 P-loop NTPase fold protein [Leptolyngbya sp. GGD]